MTRKTKLPKCPHCMDRGKVIELPGRMFRCMKCLGHFDEDPDEGGDYHADPSRRLSMKEREARRPRRELKGGL